MLLFGHRGAAAERPENTLPAFERAIEAGADVLETDVHATADGHIVVSHDETGERMAGVAAEIRGSTLAEVRRWDAGWGFLAADGRRPFAGAGYRIPTLEELLCAFPTARFNVDIKQERPPIAAAVVELLRRERAEERVTLASFSIRTMRQVRALGYRGQTALAQRELVYLLGLPAAAWRLFGFAGDRVQVPVRHGPVRFASRRFVAKCHALGLAVDFWTIDDPSEAEGLLNLGADGIMSDDPARLAPLFERRRCVTAAA
ncbi:MAG: glycerophosphodiester phosphodiesterase [Deltaproteobacteria bacterium]|nr:glycerophosphodiester phosphodiesterase [Deltaproteobacteria bacterium]